MKLNGCAEDFDFNCLIRLGFPRLRIEKAELALQKAPISLEGEILLSHPRQINLIVSTGRFKARLREAAFYFTEQGYLKTGFREAGLSYQLPEEPCSLLFKDLEARLDLKDRRFKFAEFESQIYDGHLQGEGYIDLKQRPLKSALNLNLADISANRLSSVLVHFGKVFGQAKMHLFYSSLPQPAVRGQIVVREGYLDRLEFFIWLAQFFNIPQLNKISFDRLDLDFTLDNRGARLNGINLSSPDVNLSGYYNLSRERLVSSKISLLLSQKLLRASPDFQALFKALKQDYPELEFKFQLSGPSRAINFKWLKSDFRKRLREKTPAFIQKDIEKKVEDIIRDMKSKNL